MEDTRLYAGTLPTLEMYGAALLVAGSFFLLAALNLRQRESRLIFFL